MKHSCDVFGDGQDHGSPGSLSESLPPGGYLDRGIKNILEKKLNGEPV